jgi:hypothetical protein
VHVQRVTPHLGAVPVLQTDGRHREGSGGHGDGVGALQLKSVHGPSACAARGAPLPTAMRAVVGWFPGEGQSAGEASTAPVAAECSRETLGRPIIFIGNVPAARWRDDLLGAVRVCGMTISPMPPPCGELLTGLERRFDQQGCALRGTASVGVVGRARAITPLFWRGPRHRAHHVVSVITANTHDGRPSDPRAEGDSTSLG